MFLPHFLVEKFFQLPILCCPGPVQLHRSVKRRLKNTQICHRDSAFEELQTKTANNILEIAGTDSGNHIIAFTTGSGTTANESTLIALGKLGPTLVLTNGEFGERLHELSLLHHLQTKVLTFGWGKKINLNTVADEVQTNSYASIVVVHHETSTGMLNPIKKLAKIAHRSGAVLFVDAVSSLGAEEFNAAGWDIDVFTSSSGKALSSIPGIGVVAINHNLASRISKTEKTVQYLDLTTYIDYAQNYRQTPNTPSVHALAALESSTSRIVKIGARHSKKIENRAAYVRNMLERLGLEYFYYEQHSTSNVVTCVKVAEGLDTANLLAYMRLRGIVLYSGKGELKDQIFQIGHIGELSRLNMRYVMHALSSYMKTIQLTDQMPYTHKNDQLIHAKGVRNATH